jgi:dienelactone hydrolase
MTEQSRFYSKDSAPRVFTGDAAEQRAVTEEIRQAARQFAERGYRVLASHT